MGINKPPGPDKEQQKVINEIEYNNVICQAVAGSGKTTTALHICIIHHNLKILILSYNNNLKTETKNSIDKYKIKNTDVHTFHSFICSADEVRCNKDEHIENNLERLNFSKTINYDIIIIDESQDMTPIYFKLVCKIYRNNLNKDVKLCIMGDIRQAIYKSFGADYRYISYAKEIFKFNSIPWKNCKLKVSYRLTNTATKFINECMSLDSDVTISPSTANVNRKDTPKPRYIICDTFSDQEVHSKTLQEIQYYIETLKYTPEDIFILAPSIRRNIEYSGNNNHKNPKSPCSKLEHLISKSTKLNKKINIYCCNENVSSKEKKENMKNKLVISSFHKSKGLERDVVIVMNFDESYFKFFNTNDNPNICSNQLFVAVTRSKKHLSLIHHKSNNYLPFLKNSNELNKYCEVLFNNNIKINDETKTKKINTTHINNYLSNIDYNTINKCYNCLKVIDNFEHFTYDKLKNIKYTVESNLENIDPESKIKTNSENVKDINVKAFILLMLRYRRNMKIEILNRLKEIEYEKYLFENYNRQKLNKLENFINIDKQKYNLDLIDENNITFEQLLYLSNCWNARETNFICKCHQISNYNWIEQTTVDEMNERFSKLNISDNNLIDGETEAVIKIGDKPIRLFVDCIDVTNKTTYKFVYDDETDKTNYIILALFMYARHNKGYKYVLYNIVTNEYKSLSYSKVSLDKLITILKDADTKKDKPDEQFLKENKEIRDNMLSSQQNMNGVKKKTRINDKLRFEVWKEYCSNKYIKGICTCCGTTKIDIKSFHCGHVIAESKGGTTDIFNLRPICQGCNLSMGTKNMEDFKQENFKR